jgi:hypothetical protein
MLDRQEGPVVESRCPAVVGDRHRGVARLRDRAHFVHISPGKCGNGRESVSNEPAARRPHRHIAAGHTRRRRILYQNVNRLLPAAL